LEKFSCARPRGGTVELHVPEVFGERGSPPADTTAARSTREQRSWTRRGTSEALAAAAITTALGELKGLSGPTRVKILQFTAKILQFA
jgi:hypothetical protein